MRNEKMAISHRLLVISASVVCLIAGGAYASAWSNPSGANAAFAWANGQDITNKFGSPTVSPAGFEFTALNGFRAQRPAGNGFSAIATDTAIVDVNVDGSNPPGANPVQTIIVQEWGTWSANTNSSNFAVSADLDVLDWSSGLWTGPQYLAVSFDPNGTWTAALTFSGVSYRQFTVKVANTISLTPAASPGFITKDGMRVIVPEPASVLMVLGGLMVLTLRGRRR